MEDVIWKIDGQKIMLRIMKCCDHGYLLKVSNSVKLMSKLNKAMKFETVGWLLILTSPNYKQVRWYFSLLSYLEA